MDIISLVFFFFWTCSCFLENMFLQINFGYNVCVCVCIPICDTPAEGGGVLNSWRNILRRHESGQGNKEKHSAFTSILCTITREWPLGSRGQWHGRSYRWFLNFKNFYLGRERLKGRWGKIQTFISYPLFFSIFFLFFFKFIIMWKIHEVDDECNRERAYVNKQEDQTKYDNGAPESPTAIPTSVSWFSVNVCFDWMPCHCCCPAGTGKLQEETKWGLIFAHVPKRFWIVSVILCCLTTPYSIRLAGWKWK